MAQPRTFLVGVTQPDTDGLWRYLKVTGQDEFLAQFEEAMKELGPICLCSFYAKLCYKSLVLGKNANVSRVRDIQDNLESIVKTGHGSVLEHVWLNFITTDCSRVFTHELVRHRVGTAFSQTSGRYCTVEDAELVLPPELEEAIVLAAQEDESGDKRPAVSIADDMRILLQLMKDSVAKYRKVLGLDESGCNFDRKKRLTSALRRIMPNGAVNEIGWSVNIRSLRHLIEMRTSRHAEWEIRAVFAEVAKIVEERWPLMLYGAEVEQVDGMPEYRNLRI